MLKLELGSGPYPEPGYVSSDPNPTLPNDYQYDAWAVPLEPQSVDEIIALGVIEHLTYQEVAWTLSHARELLKPDAPFLFDVPDIEVWCDYMAMREAAPFPREHILATIYGWQRWLGHGDVHKSGWNREMLQEALEKAGFQTIRMSSTPEQFTSRGIHRRRFDRPLDAHIYVMAS